MANKIVQLVDKNSNNLYPVAGAVITDAVSTGAISSQAVTNPKIENGAVNGVENNATAIGTAKLALDTVGTPNLRDASVTSDKIDFTTFTAYEPVSLSGERANNSTSYQPLSGTYTLPADGLYFISSNIASKNPGTTIIKLAAQIRCGSTVITPLGSVSYSETQPGGNRFATVYASTMFFGKKDDVVTVYTFINGWTGGTDHSSRIQRIW